MNLLLNKPIMLHNIKDSWGVYVATIFSGVSALGAFNLVNALIAACLGLGALVLVIYRIRHKRIEKERDEIELYYLREHKNNEAFMRKWMLKRMNVDESKEKEND
jgi:hypothetical protein